MSFDPIKTLDDPPRLNPQAPAAFDQYMKELVDFVKLWHVKQRSLGGGVGYDTQDRIEVPHWWIFLNG